MTLQSMIQCAAAAGRMSIIKWLYENDNHYEYVVPNGEATLNGRFKVVKWMVDEYKFSSPSARASWISKSMDCAITKGNWLMICYLFNSLSPKSTNQGLDEAVIRGDLELVKWFHSNGFASSSETIEAAMNVVQWLYENAFTEGRHEAVIDVAPGYNHIHIVRWLQANRSEGCSKEAMSTAASHGHLPMVRQSRQ